MLAEALRAMALAFRAVFGLGGRFLGLAVGALFELARSCGTPARGWGFEGMGIFGGGGGGGGGRGQRSLRRVMSAASRRSIARWEGGRWEDVVRRSASGEWRRRQAKRLGE